MEILFQDGDIVVCVKPVGLDAEHDMPARLKEQLGGDIYPLHRLDMNVGGVMLYARTKSAAAHFSKLIQQGKMVKEYMAQVHGKLPEQGDWEDLLFKDSRRNKVFVVKRQRNGVKAARLTFTRLTGGDDSLALIRLYTGRSHQIRVQFASRGFPLLGDHKYGARDDLTAPMLWSYRLTFPYRGEVRQYSLLPPWEVVQNIQI